MGASKTVVITVWSHTGACEIIFTNPVKLSIWSLVRRPRKLLPCTPLINWFVASVNYYHKPPVLYNFSLMRWHPLYAPKVFSWVDWPRYNLEIKILMILFHKIDYVANYLFTLKSSPLTVCENAALWAMFICITKVIKVNTCDYM